MLEANLEAGRGPVATVIVQQGTLRVGDPVVAGAAWGKVKALVDDRGDHIKEALPSTPVQVLGFSEPPHAGDEMRAAKDLARARTLGEARAQRFRLSGHKPVAAAAGAKLEDLFEQISRGETATLNIVLKADVQGSLEAVTESLKRLERDDVKLSFVLRGIGGITENDVQLAAASNATIIGFNVRPDKRSRELAESSDVEIRTYEIIYKLLEDLEAAMLGLLSPVYEEIVTGRGRGARGVPGAADRRRRRLLRARRQDHPRLQGALPARGHGHLEGSDQLAAPLQGRRARGRGRASSAASGCRTSRTSRKATSSRPTRSARSPGPEELRDCTS